MDVLGFSRFNDGCRLFLPDEMKEYQWWMEFWTRTLALQLSATAGIVTATANALYGMKTYPSLLDGEGKHLTTQQGNIVSISSHLNLKDNHGKEVW